MLEFHFEILYNYKYIIFFNFSENIFSKFTKMKISFIGHAYVGEFTKGAREGCLLLVLQAMPTFLAYDQ